MKKTSASTAKEVGATFCTLLAMVSAAGCGKGDPFGRRDGGGGGLIEGECAVAPAYEERLGACSRPSSDYRPRDIQAGQQSSWPACISDDNLYHRIEPTISSIARVEAFELIAQTLWPGDRAPSAQDFTDARAIYAQEQGLDSRVQRREDIHYPPVPGGQRCSDSGVPEQFPDRCVGPAKLLPILNDAFARGSQGEARLNQAARIEAALLWFLYVSALSEVNSCTVTPRDCDSCWAYYSGGTPRDTPIGLGRYVQAIGPETHQYAYDATLGVRCWRNLDNETGVAANLALRDRALGQLDRATVRGIALIARQRFARIACSTGAAREAHFTFVKTLAPFLDRAAMEWSASAAARLRAQVEAASPEAVDVSQALAALDELFPCP